MPIETVPGAAIVYHLIAYDAQGRERRDDPGGLMSGRAFDSLKDPSVTDVFLLSHGWRGDVPAARAQYNRWIGAMAGCSADIGDMKEKRSGFRPLIIGLHWPSEPWGDDTFAGTSSFDMAGAEPVEELVSEIAAKTVDSPAARAALRTIVATVLDDNNPPHLPPEVQTAYAALNRETGLGEGGEAAPPGDDREPFDAEAVYRRGQDQAVSFGGFADGVLSPIRTLSFWVMKDRARLFGESGRPPTPVRPDARGAGRGVRFHLMGHSFGCIVASAAVAGLAGSSLPAPVDSLALIQGALSLWSYCSDIPAATGTPGYFQRLVAGRRVRGPIITTQSEFDRAVGTWYPWAAGVKGQVAFPAGQQPKYGAVGTFGVRGPGAEGEDRVILWPDHAYGFEPGRIYNIDASSVINVGGGFSGRTATSPSPRSPTPSGKPRWPEPEAAYLSSSIRNCGESPWTTSPTNLSSTVSTSPPATTRPRPCPRPMSRGSPRASPSTRRSLADLKRKEESAAPSFAPLPGVDAADLSEAGWGVVFAFGADPAIKEALDPLLKLREKQATAKQPLFRVLEGELAYRKGESKNDYLKRLPHSVGGGKGVAPGPVSPRKLPYYLLLVGGPDEIPYRFQYELDVDYAVGRLSFETAREYAYYAAAVVAAETDPVGPRRAVFFGRGTAATARRCSAPTT